ncbi:MAG: histidine triad nucleotide-binding protein [Spirochaetales bacterium]|nr:histidine triad nucleotide-binding protein [Spirochaetales bacterium]
MTLFSKIINGDIPSDKVYEDQECYAFRDINPQAPVHILVVPRKEIPNVGAAGKDEKMLLGHLLSTAAEIAASQGLADSGYRLVINTGADGGQTVDHLHIHILGGRPMAWPPG